MPLSKKSRTALRAFATTQEAKAEENNTTYFAKLTAQLNHTIQHAQKGLQRLKRHKPGLAEVDELTIYMEEYAKELLVTGRYTEAQAIQMTTKAFSVGDDVKVDVSSSAIDNAYQAHYQKAYTTEKGIATQEVIGLYYGGAIILMLVLGALLGFVLDYWLLSKLVGLFLPICLGAGLLVGVALGLLHQAKILRASI